jgi:hypothetical protein
MLQNVTDYYYWNEMTFDHLPSLNPPINIGGIKPASHLSLDEQEGGVKCLPFVDKMNNLLQSVCRGNMMHN